MTTDICGNDQEAKDSVRGVPKDFGWDVIDLGGIECSRLLEPFCIIRTLYTFHFLALSSERSSS